ncbi:MAG: M1 family metallopeptidase [Saprospiraceae bacterium]|nr:MAG: aminopeptidase [Bacteroidetes bacterium OLB9]MCO6464722.1 M1 family metallopeptidase [Saprospiraceae bacterium]
MRQIFFFLLIPFFIFGQQNDAHLFSQMYDLLPTPNTYRTATGAPGHEYFQCRADYDIKVELDDTNQRIYGMETITFYNNSPDILSFLWLQLDQNIMSIESDNHRINPEKLQENVDINYLNRMEEKFDGGFKLDFVTDLKGQPLPYFVNKTMMRVDMASPLKPGQKYSLKIKYWYNINDRFKLGSRSGYEYFKEDDNYLYTIAQFFPRMCAYNDVEGWQNKQYIGAGEFTLIFGDYKVEITVPDDHLVAATGTLQNKEKVLTPEQLARYKQAEKEFNQPIIIATQEEAIKREKTKSKTKKTWIFKADNVRDFAFATSRKFIWDAMNVKTGTTTAMAMSMYPKEGNPLWEKYSTKVVAHTLRTYSKFTIDYPYPVAWSINADRIGMEYPMICFNYGRCEKDGTYSERIKYGVISVIIHEVGHNFFPMIINSDERQWGWMDEGLNTFVQYLTEQEFERNYPSSRGEPSKIVDYMAGDPAGMVPIMTNPESVLQLGNNAYAKPATALNILRETVMGRELFDKAFKEYAQRWAFKQPYPADFFRTMEDASGVDLDWFWRGWFFTTEHNDMAISDVKIKKVNPQDPTKKAEQLAQEQTTKSRSISSIRNEKDIVKTYNEIDTTLNDFYTHWNRNAVTDEDIDEYKQSISNMTEDEVTMLNSTKLYYEIEIERIGGLIMPVIYKLEYADGTDEVIRIPAEIWRKGAKKITKVHATDQKIKRIILDPYLETADTDTYNNYYPREEQYSKFETFKRSTNRFGNQQNPMQKANKEVKP